MTKIILMHNSNTQYIKQNTKSNSGINAGKKRKKKSFSKTLPGMKASSHQKFSATLRKFVGFCNFYSIFIG